MAADRRQAVVARGKWIGQETGWGDSHHRPEWGRICSACHLGSFNFISHRSSSSLPRCLLLMSRRRLTVTPFSGPARAASILRLVAALAKEASSHQGDRVRRRVDCLPAPSSGGALASIWPRTQRHGTAQNGTSGNQLQEPLEPKAPCGFESLLRHPYESNLAARPVFRLSRCRPVTFRPHT